MKIYILTPNAKALFTSDLKNKLNTAGEVVLVEKSQEMKDILGLFDGKEEKILAIDPDFNNWTVKNEDVEKIQNLKGIVLQTTSFSWIDGAFAKSKGIPVVNLRGFSTEAVAEWTLLMALSVARKIPVVAKDEWKQDCVKHMGVEIKDKVAGIIGLGSIGTRVAELFSGIGMDIIYWSKDSEDKRFKKVELGELLKTADVISPHVAQNDETQGLLTDETLKSMKKTTIFVSTIHSIYNHDLLLQMVKESNLYGYAFEEDGGGKFATYDGNVWGGPALAWCTEDSMRKNAEQWVEAIVNASKGKFDNQINK
jgi:phosphoglycerate dehydrogenase-like enzyme